MGKQASCSTLANLLKRAIQLVYSSVGKTLPSGITVHYRAATSIAFEGIASLEDICKAATWSSPSTFTRHYKIDLPASAETAFGWRELQKVVAT